MKICNLSNGKYILVYVPTLYKKIMHSNAVAIKKSSIMQLVFHMIYILFTIL